MVTTFNVRREVRIQADTSSLHFTIQLFHDDDGMSMPRVSAYLY